MTFIHNRRTVAAIAATACLAMPASAAADRLPSTYRSDAAQTGSTSSTDRTDAAQGGWVAGQGKIAFPAAGFRGGDNPADHPGMSEAPKYAPTTIGDNPADHPGMSRAPQYDAPTMVEVVRPERTIVRDVDEVLPLILSSTALVLVLAGIGVTLVRGRRLARS